MFENYQQKILEYLKNKKSSSNKAKNSIEPQKIGLIKDSIDNMEDSIDNYIKECFASNTQVTQQKLIEKIVACNKEILYTISRGSKADDAIIDYVAKLSTRLINQIHTDMIGTNTFATSESSVIDIIDVRVGIYKDSLIKYITNYKSLPSVMIERAAATSKMMIIKSLNWSMNFDKRLRFSPSSNSL